MPIYFEVIAAVNDRSVLEKNLKSSHMVKTMGVRLWEERGHSSASKAYISGLKKCQADVVVFAHQDVYFPQNWEKLLALAIKTVNYTNPNWAVLGVFGVEKRGAFRGRVWSSGLAKELNYPLKQPVPTVSIDELVIILNRKSGIEFDPHLPAFHLYGTDIVQTALLNNKGAYIFNGPVMHNSNPVITLDPSYEEAYKYMVKKWKNMLPLPTCIVPLTKTCWPLYLSRFKNFKKKLLGQKPAGKRLENPISISKKLGYEES
ncbi:hypothetical protein KAR91_15135 [Candidatus Pacearchaeota archaeon]|nr:hypothetical protein [Candidatus Pacearchaeota archaeon]